MKPLLKNQATGGKLSWRNWFRTASPKHSEPRLQGEFTGGRLVNAFKSIVLIICVAIVCMTEGCGAFRAVIRQFQVHPKFSESNVSKIRAGMTIKDVVSLFGSPDKVDVISSSGSPSKGGVISPFGSSGTTQQTKPEEDESGEKKADLQPKQFTYW